MDQVRKDWLIFQSYFQQPTHTYVLIYSDGIRELTEFTLSNRTQIPQEIITLIFLRQYAYLTPFDFPEVDLKTFQKTEEEVII